jgi:hypothetical protein
MPGARKVIRNASASHSNVLLKGRFCGVVIISLYPGI